MATDKPWGVLDPIETSVSDEVRRPLGGVSLRVSFSRQSTISQKLETGSDARFPYEVRQNVVIGLVTFPLWEQEVPGSNPGGPTREPKPQRRLAMRLFLCGASGRAWRPRALYGAKNHEESEREEIGAERKAS